MNFKDFTSKAAFQFKKHAPKIYTGTAIASGVAAFVIGIVKADDVKKKIQDHKDRMAELHADIEEMDQTEDALLPAERRRLIVAEYGKTAFEVGKVLALPIGLELLSIGSIAANYVDNKKRYTAVSTLLSASILAYQTLRDNIAEKYGEDEAQRLCNGIVEHEFEEVEVDEKGKEKVVKKKVKDYNINDPYAIVWGIIYDKDGKEVPTSRYYDTYETNNLRYTFLEGIQRSANDKLIAKGYLTLAEVFDMLGYTPYLKSKELIRMASEVGWIYNKYDQVGDPYVKIGIGKDDQNSLDFKEGKENFIILSFNCMGSIFAEIPKLFR